MGWGMFAYGFGMGTFKYLFAQWIMVATYQLRDADYGFIDVFLPPYLGAVATMSVFYWGSEYFMKRAKQKQIDAKDLAHKKGLEFIPKKKFTKLNRLLVKVRLTLGIYAFTFLAPLFLSIPGGSVVCAKFFGHQTKTFPLMLFFTGIYGAGMSLLFISLYD